MVKLLTANRKLESASEYGWLATGLSLLPGRKSGVEMCPDRGACFATCLDTSGHGMMPNVVKARMERAKFYVEHPEAFITLLDLEVEKHVEAAAAKDLRPAVRLNVLSDLPWEEIVPELFKLHPEVQFYDYTKSRQRARDSLKGWWPSNYNLTYSWNERSTGAFGSRLLRDGGRIAYVMREDTVAPAWMRRAGFVDGDEHDLIFLHPPGSIQALKPKGKLRSMRTAFA